MSGGQQRFAAAARRLGVTVEVGRWPAGTRTAADAAAAIGCELGQIVKSLVVIADGVPAVALTSGANRIDLDRLAAVLGVDEVRMADAEEVRAATGFVIGGTPPFGFPESLPVVADRDLLVYDRVWAAAGSPTANFALAPRRLVEISGAQVADFAR